MKKKTMTVLLHAVLAVGAVIAAAVFFWMVPELGKAEAQAAPEFAWAFWPCLIWAWCFAVPIFAAVVPAWRIFSSISAPGGAFTRANVRSLRLIAVLAFADGLIFPAGMLIVGFLGAGSAPLAVLITPAVMFCCAAVGIACLCLARLVEEAVELREENDLTI